MRFPPSRLSEGNSVPGARETLTHATTPIMPLADAKINEKKRGPIFALLLSRSSLQKIGDLAICVTVQPVACAASAAVRVLGRQFRDLQV